MARDTLRCVLAAPRSLSSQDAKDTSLDKTTSKAALSGAGWVLSKAWAAPIFATNYAHRRGTVSRDRPTIAWTRC